MKLMHQQVAGQRRPLAVPAVTRSAQQEQPQPLNQCALIRTFRLTQCAGLSTRRSVTLKRLVSRNVHQERPCRTSSSSRAAVVVRAGNVQCSPSPYLRHSSYISLTFCHYPYRHLCTYHDVAIIVRPAGAACMHKADTAIHSACLTGRIPPKS